jgi:hypothetical protein
MMLTDRRFSQSVYASRRPTQQALPIQAKKVFARNPSEFYVPRPHQRLDARQLNDLISCAQDSHFAICL